MSSEHSEGISRNFSPAAETAASDGQLEVDERFGVYSESGTLRAVIVCRPGLAHKRLTPSNCNHFLFDDVLWTERAQEHHEQMVQEMKSRGVQVYDFHELLQDTFCQNVDSIQWVLERRLPAHDNNMGLKGYLLSLSPEGLVRALVGGVLKSDIPCKYYDSGLSSFADDAIVMDPLPNMIFQRDPSTWIYEGVCLNSMFASSRRHEVLFLEAIYRFHKMFAGRIKFWLERLSDCGTIEGGDILVAGKGVVLVGLSQRTSTEGPKLLGRELLNSKSGVHRVILCHIPLCRAMMHLDTIMTFVDKDLICAYPEAFHSITCESLVRTEDKEVVLIPHADTPFLEVLKEALDEPNMEVVWTGGNRHERETEQWNDANNLVCLKPRCVFEYDRNVLTNAAIRAKGVEVIEVASSELRSGRGGSHCMTCPISRTG